MNKETVTIESPDMGCCSCLVLIFAVIGLFTFIGWIF